ncbi:hypothetical protein LXA45_17815, partial [Erwinia amylovora]|uniref:hypothetical protein n=1 Tax=Erwinia amylovora TaxID=552 RepID=UPI0020C0F038
AASVKKATAGLRSLASKGKGTGDAFAPPPNRGTPIAPPPARGAPPANGPKTGAAAGTDDIPF